MQKPTLVVDIDGTLCPIKQPEENYEDLVPFADVIARLSEYRAQGFSITLFTARNMRTYENSLGKINKHTAPVLISWLEKWQIPYDEILFGKPWPAGGFYIDDKAIRPSEFLEHSAEGIQAILENERSYMSKQTQETPK